MPGITAAELIRHQISHNNSGIEAQYELFIPGQLIYFEGHFDDLPILPGLVQIKWAVEYAKNISGRLHVRQINRLKFSGLILPNTTLTLSINYKEETGRADFYFRSDTSNKKDNNRTFSQGQLIYCD